MKWISLIFFFTITVFAQSNELYVRSNSSKGFEQYNMFVIDHTSDGAEVFVTIGPTISQVIIGPEKQYQRFKKALANKTYKSQTIVFVYVSPKGVTNSIEFYELNAAGSVISEALYWLTNESLTLPVMYNDEADRRVITCRKFEK